MEPNGNARIYGLGFFLIASFAIAIVSYYVLKPFLAAIAWAIVLAVAFQAPWRLLHRRMPARRGLAAALMTSVIAIGVLLPAGLLVTALVGQAVDVAGRVEASLEAEHVSSLSELTAQPEVTEFLERMQAWLGMTPEEFEKMAKGFAARASSIVASLSGKLVLGVFDAVLTFVVAIVLLFFFFRDGESLSAAAVGLVPASEEVRAQMRGSLSRMVETIFRGSMLCSLVQGLTGGIGWWLAGLSSPALAGVAMAVLSLLPIGGTAIVWFPGCIWAWYLGNHGSAIFLFLWGAIVTSFMADNLLKPLLIGRSDELSRLVVFLGVFGGIAAFGLLGIFIGPVSLAVASSLLEVMRAQAQPQRVQAGT